MQIKMRMLEEKDINPAKDIWNSVVLEGVAFPQVNTLDLEGARDFFNAQSYTGVAENQNGEIVGMYILHPNNVGRCGHICNASYAVKGSVRGCHIGEKLVVDCKKQAKKLGFKILQFNAVVKTNTAALKLYEKLGFTRLGVIPKGFRLDNGEYEDIIPHYIQL